MSMSAHILMHQRTHSQANIYYKQTHRSTDYQKQKLSDKAGYMADYTSGRKKNKVQYTTGDCPQTGKS